MGIKETIRALCDTGSQVNLITKDAAERLGLRFRKSRVQFIGVGEKSLGASIGEVLITIQLRNDEYIKHQFFIVNEITNYSPKSGQTNHWGI